MEAADSYFSSRRYSENVAAQEPRITINGCLSKTMSSRQRQTQGSMLDKSHLSPGSTFSKAILKQLSDDHTIKEKEYKGM